MKKQTTISWLTSVILILVLLLSFSACGDEAAQGGFGHIQVGKDDGNTETTAVEAAPEPSSVNNAKELLAELEDQVFLDIVTGDSLSFHYYMKNPENFGLSSIEPTWGDYWTREYYEKDFENDKWIMERLTEIDPNELTEESDIILYKTLKQSTELSLRYREQDDYYYFEEPFSVRNGEYLDTPLAMAEFEFRKQTDVDTYIALLRLYGEYIERQIDYEKEKAELGFFMPDFVLDQVIEQCEGVLDGSGDGSHYLFSTFDLRIDAVEWLDDEQKDEYKEENRLALTESFFPVYERIMEELEWLRGEGSEELSKARREYFLLELQSHTSSNFDPEYIIEVLDNELMRSLIILYSAYMANENAETDYFQRALSKGGVDEDMDYIESIYASVFPKLPEHNLDMQVLPESMRFINASAYYMSQPVDDYVDNIVRVNPRSAESSPSLMFTLAHEGYGGHLLQSVYDGANGVGKLRRLLSPTCYKEGFANYGASCVLAVSDFDEALVYYAIANSTLDSVLSARIEMGIFYEGWTVKEVGAILRDMWGLDPEADPERIQTFYEIFYASRGTMCRYGFGIAFFNKLREAAEAEFEEESSAGDSFDLLKFNTRIMDIAPCHLNILEERLGYIVSREVETEALEAA